jgi:peroxiredoxin
MSERDTPDVLRQLRLPRVGEPAPALHLPATDGTTVDLATYPKPVALVFLRHLA